MRALNLEMTPWSIRIIYRSILRCDGNIFWQVCDFSRNTLSLDMCFLFLLQHMKATGSHCHPIHDIPRLQVSLFLSSLTLWILGILRGCSFKLLWSPLSCSRGDRKRWHLWSDILLQRKYSEVVLVFYEQLSQNGLGKHCMSWNCTCPRMVRYELVFYC